ncbi:LacI family DNA-binding transcriptional regulator [Actinoplanes sp. DH11]|uniref:LacI family DNA-binding transcriptional regulator n=1 Tax=Actinoplanes sp. DH11 TaxID=2857011 RepID=UPI001E562B4F|nr:LacI family DNA-binding transcriptional regulator [Actinoplanes sp. DH11]
MVSDIGEIARRAGVSRSTVSYVLTGKRPVSEGTRRRIQAVIDEVGYRPNASARALREGRTHTVGLVIPPATGHLTGVQLGFVAGVVEAAARADLDVLLSPSGGEHERSFERIVDGRRVDGVILMEIRLEDDRVTRLRRSGLPFVTIGRTAQPHGMSWVDVDYAGLIARCVGHLADLGHEHIALVNRSAELVAAGYGPGNRARSGFVRAVAERGVTGVDVCCGDTAADGEACVDQLLAAHPRVTAIATLNEAALPGIHRALQRAGRTVPHDFSVTGVAAPHWAEDFHPPLTAADIPIEEIGAQAVTLLLERISTPTAEPSHRLYSPPISLRASTGPATRPRTL